MDEDTSLNQVTLTLRMWAEDILSTEGQEKRQEKRQEKGQEKRQEIDDRMDRIIEIMRENPEISIYQMAEKLEISDKQVRTAKDKLIEQGRVKREGPDKGGHWEVLK